MALNFPGSPTNGQQYQGFVYNSTVQAWQSNPASVAPFYTADLPPTNPTTGDSWFNTNDGTMYIYTYDGNTYQWVEHRSEIARSQVGLVPVRPTSVTMGSGTATIDINGLTTFTSSGTYLCLNGIFTSAYKNYRVVINLATSTSSAVDFRYSIAGTSTSTNYTQGSVRAAGNILDNYSMGSGGPRHYLLINNSSQANSASASIDIFAPNLATYTGFISTGSAFDGTYPISLIGGGVNQNATAFDGLYFVIGSGTITGTVKVFGYN